MGYMQSEKVPISSVKLNAANPRTIRDEKFKKLVKSIRDFPEMLDLRPIVVNSKMEVLGGNMRLRACLEAGLTEVPIIRAEHLTDEQQREFIVKDNVAFGEWDWEALANEWDTDDLSGWGVDIPNFELPESISGSAFSFSDKNKEINVDTFDDKCTIVLTYTMEEHEKVKTALHKIAETPEQAIWELLNL